MVIAKPSNFLSEPEDVQIASGNSLSGDINMAGRHPVAISMPVAWTAAGITFEVSVDGVLFQDLYNAGTEYQVSAAGGRHITVDPRQFRGARYMRVRSGTSGTPVVQAADRDLVVMFAEPDKNF